MTQAADLGPPHDVSPPEWRKEVQLLKIVIRMNQQHWAAAHREAVEVLRLNGIADSVREHFAALDPREALTAFFKRSLERMKAPEWAGRIPPTRFARIHAALGESDAALDWLERAEGEADVELLFVVRNPASPSMLAFCPDPDPPSGLVGRRHEGTDGVEYGFELAVVPRLECVEASSKVAVFHEQRPDPDKSTHHLDAGRHCDRALKNGGQHDRAVFREGVRERRREPQ